MYASPQASFVEDVNAYLTKAAKANPKLRYKSVQVNPGACLCLVTGPSDTDASALNRSLKLLVRR
jgi:hypothetical protein